MFLQDKLIAWFALCPAVSMSDAVDKGNEDGDEGKDEEKEGRIGGEAPEL